MSLLEKIYKSTVVDEWVLILTIDCSRIITALVQDNKFLKKGS
ncbi:hypothetical protein AOR13_1432 [Alteromonas stellipolaris LMG 21856]|nr:hypothetical protein AOR13_1432 [Alteromonas stellipolaris LMG 21856]